MTDLDRQALSWRQLHYEDRLAELEGWHAGRERDIDRVLGFVLGIAWSALCWWLAWEFFN